MESSNQPDHNEIIKASLRNLASDEHECPLEWRTVRSALTESGRMTRRAFGRLSYAAAGLVLTSVILLLVFMHPVEHKQQVLPKKHDIVVELPESQQNPQARVKQPVERIVKVSRPEHHYQAAVPVKTPAAHRHYTKPSLPHSFHMAGNGHQKPTQYKKKLNPQMSEPIPVARTVDPEALSEDGTAAEPPVVDAEEHVIQVVGFEDERDQQQNTTDYTIRQVSWSGDADKMSL